MILDFSQGLASMCRVVANDIANYCVVPCRLSCRYNASKDANLRTLPMVRLYFIWEYDGPIFGKVKVENNGTLFTTLFFLVYGICLRAPEVVMRDPFHGHILKFL